MEAAHWPIVERSPVHYLLSDQRTDCREARPAACRVIKELTVGNALLQPGSLPTC